MGALMVFCTCPDEPSAERIALALVEEHLAACVNRIPAVTSTYRWQGRICRDQEHLLLIKTVRERFPALRERIAALHPHEMPEVIALDISAGSQRYLSWVESATRA